MDTFSLVQTIESDKQVILTTVPSFWTMKIFYPPDDLSATHGNDLVYWPQPTPFATSLVGQGNQKLQLQSELQQLLSI